MENILINLGYILIALSVIATGVLLIEGSILWMYTAGGFLSGVLFVAAGEGLSELKRIRKALEER